MKASLRIVGTVAALGGFAAVVLATADGGGLSAPTAPSAPATLVALLAALVGNNVLCAARWRLFLSPRPPLSDAVRRYSEAVFVAVVVPGGVGGDVYRSAQSGIAPVVADRAIGGLVTLTAAGPALLLVGGAELWWIAAAAGVYAVLLAAFVVVRKRLVLTARQLTGAVALSVAYLASFALVVAAVSAAVGVPPSFGWACAAAPLVAAAGMAPSLNGLSPSYAVLTALLAQRGAGSGAVTTAAALMLGIQLTAAGLGGLSLVLRRPRRVAACVSS